MVKLELADEMGVSIDNLTLNTGKFQIIHFDVITGTGASAASVVYAVVPYKRWRAIDAAIEVVAAGTSTIAEKCRFGLLISDAGATDDDYIGTLAQDVTGGKNWAAGDCDSLRSNPMLGTPLALGNAGTTTKVAGVGIDTWLTGQGIITLTKDNVGSSTATLLGHVLIEVS